MAAGRTSDQNCSHVPVKVLPLYLGRHVPALEWGSQRREIWTIFGRALILVFKAEMLLQNSNGYTVNGDSKYGGGDSNSSASSSSSSLCVTNISPIRDKSEAVDNTTINVELTFTLLQIEVQLLQQRSRDVANISVHQQAPHFAGNVFTRRHACSLRNFLLHSRCTTQQLETSGTTVTTFFYTHVVQHNS